MTFPYRPHERSTRPRSNGRGDGGLARSRPLLELEREHRAEPRTSPMSAWREAMLVEARAKRLAELVARRARNSSSETVSSTTTRRRARERISAERAAEAAGRHRVHDLGTAGHARERKAAADRLAGDEQVRLDAVVVLDRPHAPGAADAGLHLVVDVQDPVGATAPAAAPDSRAA